MAALDDASRFNIPPNVKKLTDWNLEFAFKIYQLMTKNIKGNMALSPINIAAVLNVISNGPDKETAENLKNVLKLDIVGTQQDINKAFEFVHQSIKSSKVVQENKDSFSITNTMHIQNSCNVSPDFLRTVRCYNTTLTKVNFNRDAKTLNETCRQWFKSSPAENASKLSQDIVNEKSLLALCSAIHFKVPWKIMFDKKNTSRGLFHKTVSQKMVTRYMNLKANFNFIEKDRPECQMIQLNFCSSGYEMYAILPKRIDGLTELETSMTSKVFKSLRTSMTLTKMEVIMPKFSIDTGFLVQEVDEDLGIKIQPQSEVTGTSSNKTLHPTTVLQKTHVEIAEDGHINAGQSIAQVRHSKKSMTNFNANHPFMFIIYDNRREIILFIGRVTEPMK